MRAGMSHVGLLFTRAEESASSGPWRLQGPIDSEAGAIDLPRELPQLRRVADRRRTDRAGRRIA
jgi:hypothetical protein